jgi:hypothetical protein
MKTHISALAYPNTERERERKRMHYLPHAIWLKFLDHRPPRHLETTLYFTIFTLILTNPMPTS